MDLVPPTRRSNHDDVRIHLLGRFGVQSGSTLVLDETWGRGRAKALLKYLALQEGHVVHREQLMDAL